MHLVFDCRCVHSRMGGIGRAAWELARALAKGRRDHRLTVLLGPDAPESFEIPGVPAAFCDAAMIDERFEQLQLPVTLESLRADVYLNPTFSVPAIKTTRRQIAIIHDVVFEDRPEWVEPGLRNYLQRWSRFSAEQADHLLTVSDHALSRIQKVYGVGAARITRVYNGIAEEAFAMPTQDEINRVRHKFRLDVPFALYLGTLEPKKGIAELIAAFARLGFKGLLVMAGGKSGPSFDLDGLIQRSGCADRIRRLGYIDESDKRPLLAACDLFVYPSLYEGFGLPPLEAMALGRPCVVGNRTSLPEVAGDAALIGDVQDVDAFAKTLERGLHDEIFRHRALSRGPAHARNFSWEHSARQVWDVCERPAG